MCTHTWLRADGRSRSGASITRQRRRKVFIFYTERTLASAQWALGARQVHCALCRVFGLGVAGSGVSCVGDEGIIFYATSLFSARRWWCVTVRNGRNTFRYSGADRTVRCAYRPRGAIVIFVRFSLQTIVPRRTIRLRRTVLETNGPKRNTNVFR